MIPLAPSPLGHEALDGRDCPLPLARATLRDLESVNTLFGGVSAAAFGLEQLLSRRRDGGRLTLLDVGAGAGDIAAALARRARALDVVLASQLLHHFDRSSAAALLRTFAELARVGVIVAEPRRGAWAAVGIWLAALVLGLHPVTRRDGVLTVRRSFTAAELRALLRDAGVQGSVRRHRGFRLVAVCEASRAHR